MRNSTPINKIHLTSTHVSFCGGNDKLNDRINENEIIIKNKKKRIKKRSPDTKFRSSYNTFPSLSMHLETTAEYKRLRC